MIRFARAALLVTAAMACDRPFLRDIPEPIPAADDGPLAPQAQDLETREDTLLPITLRANHTGRLIFTLVSMPSHGVVQGVPPQLTYTPAPDYFGGDELTFNVSDGATVTAAAAVSITVRPVNDPPRFTAGPAQNLVEDAGPQTVIGWATDTSIGPTNETGQTLSYELADNTNPALFSGVPQVSSSGTLSYALAPNANGTAVVSIVARDSGGLGDGGVDTSAVGTLTVSVVAVNDRPSFTRGSDVNVDEDAGPQSLAGWASSIQAGAPDEMGQALVFVLSNDTPTLFTAAPAIDASGTLMFTPAPDAFGVATIGLLLQDDGGTAGGGVDESTAQTLRIVIASVNDPPRFTGSGDQVVAEDSGSQTVPSWATGISAGPSSEVLQNFSFAVTNDNAALFVAPPQVSRTGVLTYAPAPNAFGSAQVTVRLQDDAGTANGGNDLRVEVFTLTISAVNDAPSFVGGGAQVRLEDDAPQAVVGWATAISPGPANETSQVLTFQVTSDNPSLFAAGPAVNPANGSLSYTLAADANGSATVTVRVQDDGGSVGVDTSAPQTVAFTVMAINDAPSFTKGGDVTLVEDSPPQTIAGWATAVRAGPSEESAQAISFVVSNDNAALFSVAPVLATNGTLTFTPAINAAGMATVTLRLQDNGGTANGGVELSAVQTFRITLTGVNDAPALSGSNDLTGLVENQVDPPGDAVAALLLGHASDLDGTSPGVAVIGADASNGVWEYSLDDGTVWTPLTGVSPTSALLLASGPLVLVRFTPAAGFTLGNAPLTFRAWDGSDGRASGATGVDVSTNGGSTAFSSATAVARAYVSSVNDAPSFTKGGSQTVLEDPGNVSISGWATAISAGPSDESWQTPDFEVTNDNDGLFLAQPAIDATGTLTFRPAQHAIGSATVTVRIHDNGGTANGGVNLSGPQTFTITVNAVNDAPTFAAGVDVTANEDAGPRVYTGWATAIGPGGGADEAGQTVNFVVSNDNNALFSAQPAINIGGVLTFTSAANASGTATVTVRLQDSGGTANGGANTSASHELTITINAVNDVPVFTNGADQTTTEDSGPRSVTGWATGISAGPSETQALTFILSNDNNGLFSTQPAVDGVGRLTYTPNIDANGSTVVTVVLQDNGGVLFGGVDTTAPVTFQINVTSVNDAPSFTKGADQTALEDSGLHTVVAWVSAPSPGAANESAQVLSYVVSNDNTALFSTEPALSANGTLTYQPAVDANGSATVTVRIRDDGGTAGGGVDTSAPQTFVVSVSGVNDAPSFTAGADVVVNEDSGPASMTNWATSISKGPANESSQTLTFVVTNDNGALFAVPPAVATNGTLSFTLAANAYGTANVAVHLEDDGGTTNGGVDETAAQDLLVTVLAVNDAPSFASSTPPVSLRDAGPQSVASWATGISRGPSNEASQVLSFVVTPGNASLFAVAPVVSAAGTLTYTAAPGAAGTSSLDVQLIDDGGTANGGVDRTSVVSTTITVNDVPDLRADIVFAYAVVSSNPPLAALAVLDNDTDDVGSLELESVGTSPNAAITIANAAQGTIHYDPNNNFTGLDVFTYTARDGLGQSVTAQVYAYVGARPAADLLGTSEIERVSVNGAPVADDSHAGALSADGQAAVYDSMTTDIVSGDTNDVVDVFARDVELDVSARVSVDSGEGQASGSSSRSAASWDMRWVVFESGAPDLVSGDANAHFDVFLRDTVGGATTRVSVSTAGGEGDGNSSEGAISADGRFVAFTSLAANLSAADANGVSDIFVRDIVANTTERVSVSSEAAEADGASTAAAISADGRFVAFTSLAANLVSSDTNGRADVFVRDRLRATTTRVSVSTSGAQATGGASEAVAISADGTIVAFDSDAVDLVSGDTNSASDVFVRDVALGLTTRIDLDRNGAQLATGAREPSLSADGRFVAYLSDSTNIVREDANALTDVFVFDRFLTKTQRVSTMLDGTEADASCSNAALSPDGRFVLFDTAAASLDTDTNGTTDVYVAPVYRGAVGFGAYAASHSLDVGFDIPALDNVATPFGSGRLRIASVSSPASGTATISGSAVHFDPDTAYRGTARIQYVVDDGLGGSVLMYAAATVSDHAALAPLTSVSLDTSGAAATLSGGKPRLSPNGKWAAFEIAAPLAVGLDTNAVSDVYLRDTSAPASSIALVSKPNAGIGNGPSFMGDVSDEGASGVPSVVFSSDASNLVTPADSNGKRDVFLNVSGAIVRVSAVNGSNLTLGDDDSEHPSMTPDTDLIVFASDATNLATDTNPERDIYLRTRSTSSTMKVSLSHAGGPADGASDWPSIAWDRRHVAFESTATNLVRSYAPASKQIYVYDLANGFISIASVTPNLDAGNGASRSPSLSADGRWVTFVSSATNLVAGDVNGVDDVFVRDLLTEVTWRISVGDAGNEADVLSTSPSLSGSGAFVGFVSAATGLVTGDTNGVADLFVREVASSATRRASVTGLGAQPDALVAEASITADGRYVTFVTAATNFPSTAPGVQQVYVGPHPPP